MLITIEGGDGSGKGTLLRNLSDYFKEQGLKVKTAREPGSVEISEEIRKVIQTPDRNLVPEAELLLFEAARVQFVKEFLKPALEENDVVILDRFYDSTTAYQGYARGLDLEMINELNELAALGIVPDITIVLDVSASTGLKRCRKDEFGPSGDRLEQETIEFHDKVRKGYLEMAEKDSRFVVIDAEKNSVKEVFELAKVKINSLL